MTTVDATAATLCADTACAAPRSEPHSDAIAPTGSTAAAARSGARLYSRSRARHARQPRRCGRSATRSSCDASPSASAAPPPTILRTKVTPKETPPVPRVKIGAVQHLKCGASPKLFAGESSLCDSLPFFEQSLVKAIDEKSDCAPKAKEEPAIYFDFDSSLLKDDGRETSRPRGRDSPPACRPRPDSRTCAVPRWPD